jgi:hypothetical protein
MACPKSLRHDSRRADPRATDHPRAPLVRLKISAVSTGGPQLWSTPLVQLWCIALDPTKHRGVIDRHATFPQQFFYVAMVVISM